MLRPAIVRLTLTSSLAFALVLPAAARADDASQHAKADEMVTLLRSERAVQQVADNVTKQIDDAADRSAGADATAEQKAKVEDFKKQAAQLIDADLGWAAMKPAIVDLYAKAFTEEQMDAIIAFYKSSAGTAFLDKLPAVNAQFGEVGNARIAGLRDQLQKSFHDLQQSLHPVPTIEPAAPTPAAPAAPAQTPAAPGAATGAGTTK